MDENEFEDYDREAELALYREYRDVVGTFKYVIETERRFYLANEVELQRVDTVNDFYFELNMKDVWVWDIYRTDRFVQSIRVLTFKEKPKGDGAMINGGFFVLSPRVIDFITGDQCSWEGEPLETIAHEGQLEAFEHHGFWQPMDTLREKNLLEELWASGEAPWKQW